MIKIWKGIEQEGIGANAEVPTLFVCSDGLLHSKLILDLLYQNSEIKAVYLGAGRTPFQGFFSDVERQDFLSHCKDFNIKIIMELQPQQIIEDRVYDPYVLYILTFYNAPFIKNLYFKTDDYKTACIYTKQKEVNIADLQDTMYLGDILVYKED